MFSHLEQQNKIFIQFSLYVFVFQIIEAYNISTRKGVIPLKIELSYKNFKELIPYSKLFLNSCYPIFKFLKFLLLISIPFYLILSPRYPSILKISDFIFVCICLLLLCMLPALISILTFKKFNKRCIFLDLEKNYVALPSDNLFEINKAKTKVLKDHDLLLVLNSGVSFAKTCVPIPFHTCDQDIFDCIIHIINQ